MQRGQLDQVFVGKIIKLDIFGNIHFYHIKYVVSNGINFVSVGNFFRGAPTLLSKVWGHGPVPPPYTPLSKVFCFYNLQYNLS